MNETVSESLEAQMKALWGASRLPGFAGSSIVLRPSHWEEPWRRLNQLVAVKASGVVYGPHGVGKSFLIHSLSRELSPKRYRVIRFVHSTLLGGDFLRQLVRLGGLNAQHRRSDNVVLVNQLWQQLGSVWPVVILEEAQNLSASTLEELRLLACERSDTQAPFSLVLVGDDDLLQRLQMGVNRALLTRLGFSVNLTPWSLEALKDYLQQRLSEVGIRVSPFDPAAEQLMLQSAVGRPRHLNDLMQRSLENAAMARRREILPEDVQGALDTLPWVAMQARART